MSELENQNSAPNEQLVYESIESLKEYLPKLIQGIEQILQYFAQRSEREAFVLLVNAFEGIQWVFEVAILTKPTLERMGIFFDEEQILGNLQELTGAMENQDFVLLTDLLEYEILEFLRQWNKRITKKSN